MDTPVSMRNEENNSAIELRSVSKIYRSYPTPRHRLLELLSGGRRQFYRETRALDDVSFSLEKGGRLGIVGENGSGKSTLLKILAGVLTPSQGKVTVNGRVSALLELGAGFNPELSGRENISQFCMLHGMREDEINSALPEIIQFSELRDAVEHPVKTYSSGMAVRLGFACSVYVQPDILIVDEALSVGDAYFQNKCLHKIRSMLDAGITFIYVTHAADAIRALCSEGLWLEKGRARLFGNSTVVGSAYQKEVFSRMVRAGYHLDTEDQEETANNYTQAAQIRLTDQSRQQAFADRVEPLRTGSGEIRIIDIELIDSENNETDSIRFESVAHVYIYLHKLKPTPKRVAITLGLYDKSGIQLIHFNSLVHGIDVANLDTRAIYVIKFSFKCPLTPGEYNIAAGITEMEKSVTSNAQMLTVSVVDYCVGGTRFSVLQPEGDDHRDLWGLCYVECDMSFDRIS